MSPQVDENFFFAENDPQFQNEIKISERFLRKNSPLIISAKGDIQSDPYYQKVDGLTNALINTPDVSGVKSIPSGPADLKDAMTSSLWKRILISQDQRSTNIIIFLDDEKSSESIKPIEKLINDAENNDFQLSASGLPYIVELIK